MTDSVWPVTDGACFTIDGDGDADGACWAPVRGNKEAAVRVSGRGDAEAGAALATLNSTTMMDGVPGKAPPSARVCV